MGSKFLKLCFPFTKSLTRRAEMHYTGPTILIPGCDDAYVVSRPQGAILCQANGPMWMFPEGGYLGRWSSSQFSLFVVK